ncbi:MAG: response regulator, partial [Gammaproteobacteria bacterium]|nr:response regulator [Gammaproteobacteria bacterium]
MSPEPNTTHPDRSLLLVDDDEAWLNHLAKAMKKRGFDVYTALSITEATIKIASVRPSYAVIDLRLEDGSGLEIVEHLRNMRHNIR